MSRYQPILEPSTIIVHQREPDDLEFFRSPAKACGYFEPNDVDEREDFYDVSGNRYRLVTKLVPRRFLFGLVRGRAEVVDLAPEVQTGSAPQLRDVLLDYLTRRGQPLPVDSPLSQLIEVALARAGYVL
jgi:hypothetical protein